MRIRIRLRSPKQQQDGKKYIILVDRSLATIRQVQQHIISTIDLDADDCIIPSGESIQILEDMCTYQCKTFYQSVDKIHREKIGKKEIMGKKKIEKKRQKVIQQSESEQSESEDQKYEIRKLKNSVIKQTTEKKVEKPAPPKIDKNKEITNKINKKAEAVPQKTKSQKLYKSKEIDKKPEITPSSNRKPAQSKKPVVYPISSSKPVQHIVQDSDDSDQQQKKPQKYLIKSTPKENIPIAVRKQQFKATHKQQQQTTQPNQFPQKGQTPQPQPPKPQILQKPQPQQQLDWKDIPVKILQRCRKTHNKSFLLEDMKILFQTTDFDQERFIPIVSDWKNAEVKSVSKETEQLVLVVQPRKEQMKLCEYNLLGLRVLANHLTDFQRQVIRELSEGQKNTPKRIVQQKQPEEAEPNKTQPSKAQPKKTQPSETQTQQQQQQPVQHQSPYREIITSQVDYYFSDKNYNRDNYLISHAALHPELYVNASVILNFPKMKRLNITQEQLIKYLAEDLKPNKTYELHPTELKLRKKGLRIQPKAPEV